MSDVVVPPSRPCVHEEDYRRFVFVTWMIRVFAVLGVLLSFALNYYFLYIKN